MNQKEKKLNKIEVGNICVQSSTEGIEQLAKVVDDILSKHKETISQVRPKIFFSSCDR